MQAKSGHCTLVLSSNELPLLGLWFLTEKKNVAEFKSVILWKSKNASSCNFDSCELPEPTRSTRLKSQVGIDEETHIIKLIFNFTVRQHFRWRYFVSLAYTVSDLITHVNNFAIKLVINQIKLTEFSGCHILYIAWVSVYNISWYLKYW